MKFLDNRRGAAAAAVSALFVVPLGVFGAPALAKTAASASEYEYSGSSQYQYKVTLCHHTHSKKHPFHQIRVAAPAVKAHMRHGDTLGTCAAAAAAAKVKHGKGHGPSNGNGKNEKTLPIKPTSSTDSHGKSGSEHGNGQGNGRGHGK
jgi:hypothetical protein